MMSLFLMLAESNVCPNLPVHNQADMGTRNPKSISQGLQRLTGLTTGANFADIANGQFGLRIALAAVVAILGNHVLHVVPMCSEKQMLGVDAWHEASNQVECSERLSEYQSLGRLHYQKKVSKVQGAKC